MHGNFHDRPTSPEIIARRKKRNAAWRGKIGRLIFSRFGNHFVPDSAEGRALLSCMLRCGLRADDAKERALWIADGELRKLRRAARRLPLWQFGKEVALTHVERMASQVYFLPACDLTLEEAARLQEERDRENARRRRRRFRERIAMMRHTAARDDAILRMLKMPRPAWADAWMSVSELVKEADRCEAFRRPDGRWLRNARDAVHCVLGQLERNGQI
jgi:hypothetical protein